jgi:thiol-disulfide isomerase/thioredoxin
MSASLRRINPVRTLAAMVMAGVISAVALPIVAASSARNRKPAPDFSLTDANGARIILSAYKGRVVLLDFWATWCTGCKVEIPWYVEFQRKYAQQGLTSIGVAMDDEGWQKVKPYLEIHPIDYPIVLGNPDLVEPYRITNMPVTLLIDREGNIADAHVGMVAKDAWEREIQQLLHEKSR